MRIVVADNCPATCMGLKTILGQDGTVIGETRDSEKLLLLTRKLRPDLVVVNLNLSGKYGGIEACSRLKASFDAPYVLVHTAYNFAENLSPCVQAGVDGYLHTHSQPTEFLNALRRILAGEPVWEIGRGLKQENVADNAASNCSQLTPRELEVMRLKFQRHSNAEIAEQLRISIHTVKHHVTHINQKIPAKKVERPF